MIERLRPAIAPAFLFLCLVLGGSPQGTWGELILQLLAILLIAWGLFERREASLPRPVKQLALIAAAAVALAVIQLVPLPLGLGTTLPGRELVAEGFELLGVAPAAMPVSLAPYDSFATLLTVLPMLGMLSATLLLRAYTPPLLALALISGAIAGVLIGILQVSSPIPEQSPWYLYRISNFGVATGFFANSNHMATLLFATIPFTAAIGAQLRSRSTDDRLRSVVVAVAAGGLVLVVLGLILNRSLAGYGLGILVVLASLLMLFGARMRWAGGALAIVGLASIGAIALIWVKPISAPFGDLGASTSIMSRNQIASNSVVLVRRYAPLGSGLGTFPKVYQMQEDPALVDRVYVNHAHNDYLELAVETGLPGVLLIAAFLFWWVNAIWRMVRSPAADQFAFAGAIASCAILLHSMVDYPLRTAAIGAVFAMSLALVLQSRRSARSDKDLRPVRHLVVG